MNSDNRHPTKSQTDKILRLGGDPNSVSNQLEAEEYTEYLENIKEDFDIRVSYAYDYTFGDPDVSRLMCVKRPPKAVMARALKYGDAQGWGNGWECFGSKEAGNDGIDSYSHMEKAVYAVAPELLKKNATPPVDMGSKTVYLALIITGAIFVLLFYWGWKIVRFVMNIFDGSAW